MRAKKSKARTLGQHFLTSNSAVEAMIASAETQKGDFVLEIGPGKGVLTEALLQTGAVVVAVEKDDTLIPALAETFSKEISSGQLKIIHGDILKYNPESLMFSDLDAVLGASADGDQDVLNSTAREQTQASNNGMRQNWKQYKLIANIPYYITGEIMRLFLTATRKPSSITLLVQKEVAERIVAKDKKESILSLSVKFFGRPTYIQTVRRGSFNPPPKVDSAIIHISDICKIENVSEDDFFKLIKAGFKSKRKKLISNLSPLYDKGALSHAFEKLALSENTRAEDLNIGTWIQIQNTLKTTA